MLWAAPFFVLYLFIKPRFFEVLRCEHEPNELSCLGCLGGSVSLKCGFSPRALEGLQLGTNADLVHVP